MILHLVKQLTRFKDIYVIHIYLIYSHYHFSFFLSALQLETAAHWKRETRLTRTWGWIWSLSGTPCPSKQRPPSGALRANPKTRPGSSSPTSAAGPEKTIRDFSSCTHRGGGPLRVTTRVSQRRHGRPVPPHRWQTCRRSSLASSRDWSSLASDCLACWNLLLLWAACGMIILWCNTVGGRCELWCNSAVCQAPTALHHKIVIPHAVRGNLWVHEICCSCLVIPKFPWAACGMIILWCNALGRRCELWCS